MAPRAGGRLLVRGGAWVTLQVSDSGAAGSHGGRRTVAGRQADAWRCRHPIESGAGSVLDRRVAPPGQHATRQGADDAGMPLGTFSQAYGSILSVILHINDAPCCSGMPPTGPTASWPERCASPALALVPLIFSYKSEKSLCGAGWFGGGHRGGDQCKKKGGEAGEPLWSLPPVSKHWLLRDGVRDSFNSSVLKVAYDNWCNSPFRGHVVQ